METENAHGPELLTVASTATDGTTVVTVTGEIDHTTAAPLIHALDLGELRVVVDMRHVTFMDSSGINVLLVAHRELTQADGWLRLAGVPTSVLRTLQIVGIDAVIPCYIDLHEALEAWGNIRADQSETP
ncbi:STAS domain-containing protein [Streptomyces sp. NPDC059688]|uniref:STAS domain-containing protein n=1 Tax=Streptomyces sp. NPDC059688 TaxID=3346906 RepID=UPI00367BCA4B